MSLASTIGREVKIDMGVSAAIGVFAVVADRSTNTGNSRKSLRNHAEGWCLRARISSRVTLLK